MKRLRKPLCEPDDERGATLLLVLVVVTVVALAGAALLSFSDTSLRTTVALRGQGAAAYAADGAGQVAVAELTGGTYPNNCATVAGDPLPLGNGTAAFYASPQSGATALNAYVSCAPDVTTANLPAVGPNNKPPNAIFTVGNDSGVIGQSFTGKPIAVNNGSVFSNSSVSASGGLTVTGTGATVKAHLVGATGCLPGGSITPACIPGAATVPTPAPTTYNLPPGDPVTAAQVPWCATGNYALFYPGLYNTSYLTNYLNKGCGQKSVVWFSPGTYYFTYTGSWNAPATLVGGTPIDTDTNKPIAGLDSTDTSTLSKLSQLKDSPGACANPSEQAAPGVMFVFGGSTRVNLKSNTFEICATYVDANTVPVAIYGPTANIVNGGTVTTETVCKSTTCTLFYNGSSGHSEFHIQGFTFAPNARVELAPKNTKGQVFGWGLVLRSFLFDTNGAYKAGAVSNLPADTTGGTTPYSIMYLNVWVCPKSGVACDHSGSPQLQAKVQVTGSPATATVLSWSVQR